MNIDAHTLAAAERIAMAEYNRKVADEVRHISAAASRHHAPAAGKTTTMTSAEARDDAAKSKASADEDRKKFEAEYARDPKLREEFGEMATYVAYKKAETSGKIKIISNRITRFGK